MFKGKLASVSNFGLAYRKTPDAYFHLPGPGYDIPFVLPVCRLCKHLLWYVGTGVGNLFG